MAAVTPFPIYVPVAEAMIIMAWDHEGIPGDWNIPIRQDHWLTVTALIREGDQIAIVAEEGGQAVITIPAIVVTLNPLVPCIQVIA